MKGCNSRNQYICGTQRSPPSAGSVFFFFRFFLVGFPVLGWKRGNTESSWGKTNENVVFRVPFAMNLLGSTFVYCDEHQCGCVSLGVLLPERSFFFISFRLFLCRPALPLSVADVSAKFPTFGVLLLFPVPRSVAS